MKQMIYLLIILFNLILIVHSQTTISSFKPQKFIIGASLVPELNTRPVTFASDFDGDGKADLGSFAISGINQGSIKIDKSSIANNNNAFDLAIWDLTLQGYGDISAHPVPADYGIFSASSPSADGVADISMKTDDGRWLIDYADNGFGTWDIILTGFGDATAHPVPADYGIFSASSPSADGITDISVKTDDGRWLIDYADNGFGSWDVVLYGYGDATAHPIPSDYDNDGKTDISIKTDDGRWLIDYAYNGFGSWDWIGTGFGGPDCIPVPGKYYNPNSPSPTIKKTYLAIKKNLTQTGDWVIYYEPLLPTNATNYGLNNMTTLFGYGSSLAIPVVADYNGDGYVDISVTTDGGKWLIDYSSVINTQTQVTTFGYGSWDFLSNDLKLKLDFNLANINLLTINDLDYKNLIKVRDAYINLLIDPLVNLDDEKKIYYLGLLDKISKVDLVNNPSNLSLDAMYSSGKYVWFAEGKPNLTFRNSIDVNSYQNELNIFNSIPFNLKNKIYGVSIGDEPSHLADFMDPDPAIGSIKFWTTFFNDPANGLSNKPTNINLLPKYGFQTSNAYESYLDAFKTVSQSSPFICFDHYPFRRGVTQTFEKSYFYNLEILKRKFPDRSLLAFVHSATREGGIIDANYSQTKFLAFSPIAYGAKGILYWPYLANKEGGIGESESKYNFIKKINKYITDIVGPIIIQNSLLKTLHISDNVSINVDTNSTDSYPFSNSELLSNYRGIIKDVKQDNFESASDILIGIFSNESQNHCNYVSASLTGSYYYLWVVNNNTHSNGVGKIQNNLKIILRGKYLNSQVGIFKGVDDYINTSNSNLQYILQPSYNSTTDETTISIDVLNPGEGRMIQLYVTNNIPIKPQAPVISTSSTRLNDNNYKLTANISLLGATVANYKWYNENDVLLFTSTLSNEFIFQSDNCPHLIYCTVTYADCNIESEKSNPLSILGNNPSQCSEPCNDPNVPCEHFTNSRNALLNKEELNFIVYPNPNNGNFSIEFNSNSKGVNIIDIFDMYGRSVLLENVLSSKKNFSISKSFSKGVYTIKITNTVTGKTQFRKVLVSN